VEIDSIPITDREMDVCEGLGGKMVGRLMFALICYAKFYDALNPHNDGWVNRPDKEVFKAANIVK